MNPVNCVHTYTPRQFLSDTCLHVRNALGRVFSTLAAIQEDGNATIQLLKVCRYAIFVFRAYYGKFPGSSILNRDWKTTINFLEGWQFVAAISSLLPAKKNNETADEAKNIPLLEKIKRIITAAFSIISDFFTDLEKITTAAFVVSDCFSGSLWLLAKGVPVLGAYSESVKVIKSLEIVALAAALVGSITDGGSAAKIISNHWKVSVPDKTTALWQLCERITGVVSLILILAGVVGTLAHVATGLAAASALCGLIRFGYKWNLPKETKETY